MHTALIRIPKYLLCSLLCCCCITTMAQTNETVRDSSFVIADDVQDYYEGSYKNGEPYKGYFKVGDNEIYQINFYDKGKLIYQYSYDFLKYLQHTEDEAYSYNDKVCLLYTSPSPRDRTRSRMPSSA